MRSTLTLAFFNTKVVPIMFFTISFLNKSGSVASESRNLDTYLNTKSSIIVLSYGFPSSPVLRSLGTSISLGF